MFFSDVPPICRISVKRKSVHILLKELALENAKRFGEISMDTTWKKRILEACNEMAEYVDFLGEVMKPIEEVSVLYDYDEEHPGNGFRSLICVCDIVVIRLIEILKSDNLNRYKVFCKQVEGLSGALRFLILAFPQVYALIGRLDHDSLFPSLDGDYEKHNDIFMSIECLDSKHFYGSGLAIQFTPSIKKIFYFVCYVLASYSHFSNEYNTTQRTTSDFVSSVIQSAKMLINQETKCERIYKVTREADIGFCRNFWNLAELPPMWLLNADKMAISIKRTIILNEIIFIQGKNGEKISISPPQNSTKIDKLGLKILSSTHRVGLSNKASSTDISSNLIIHCHGGGYVATSTEAHESYLRKWAKELNCTLISVDYSLAPEKAFPTQLEEVLYAYAYILNNPKEFGWTGEKLCMVGDSAGGNLVVSTVLRMVELGVKRLPDGIVPIYTPFLFQYLPSPSRILSFMDPLLHMGVVIRCAAAYCGKYTNDYIDRDCKYRTHPETAKLLPAYLEDIIKFLPNQYSEFAKVCSSFTNYISPIFLSASDNLPKTDRSPEGEHTFNTEETDEVKLFIEQETSTIGDKSLRVQVDDDPYTILLSTEMIEENLIDYLRTNMFTYHSIIEHPENINIPTPIQYVTTTMDDSDSTLFRTPTQTSSRLRRSQSFSNSWCLKTPITPISPYLITPTKKRTRLTSFDYIKSMGETVVYTLDALLDKWEPQKMTDELERSRLCKLMDLGDVQLVAQAQLLIGKDHQSHFTNLLKLDLPRDPLTSPLYASDNILKQLPPLSFVSCHMDPLLDDSIMFAKRLRDCGGNVKSFDMLSNLPHGFLNFAVTDADCMSGTMTCCNRIKDFLRF